VKKALLAPIEERTHNSPRGSATVASICCPINLIATPAQSKKKELGALE
jgi:hypothetical protein